VKFQLANPADFHSDLARIIVFLMAGKISITLYGWSFPYFGGLPEPI
jgi:hypothetical protein